MVAAVYCRKSTTQDGVADDQKSVARQLAHARAYAIRKGWTVEDAHVFVDDGVSGAEFANRPGFLRLMNALKPRAPFQVLIMSEESRLGRESIEVSYALKTLVQAGVRVWLYLEDRERTLDSPTDKIMLSLTTFADELEREKARQRTYDAMLRKAKAGHVTGGRLFGYDNIDVTDASGQRSHVERQINEAEAAVIRRIFALSVEGHGLKAITKILNAEGAPSPRAQRGRPQSWAPTSVREVLYRDVYRGTIAWNRTRKRNRWGIHKQAARPAAEWLSIPAPSLQIISAELWSAAHDRMERARAIYLRGTRGEAFGRPALANPSKYLLTNLGLCGQCGGTLHVVSRSHGASRKHLYGCSGFHERGTCQNRADVPMADANLVVVEALLDDVLDEGMVADAVDEAITVLRGVAGDDRGDRLDRDLAAVTREHANLMKAVQDGDRLSGLLEALRALDRRRQALEADRAAIAQRRGISASEADIVRDELLTLASSWRVVLADDPTHARPIVSSLLKGRVTFAPIAANRWRLTGEGTLSGLFSREWTGRSGVPNGIRTRVLALKGPRPGPLDDGDLSERNLMIARHFGHTAQCQISAHAGDRCARVCARASTAAASWSGCSRAASSVECIPDTARWASASRACP
jgi:site-specific DNA recombinase